MTELDRSALRRSFRLTRKTLSSKQQADAALAALTHLISQPEYINAEHIALYWAADGELDPALIASYAALEGKKIYLPVVRRTDTNRRELIFLRYQAGQNMAINHFGIPEPLADAETIAANKLDLILVPLVAIDKRGNRLGMGGGFYDFTFNFKQTTPTAKPCLIGFSHHFQLMDDFAPDAWDVPMDAWLSDEDFLRVR